MQASTAGYVKSVLVSTFEALRDLLQDFVASKQNPYTRCTEYIYVYLLICYSEGNAICGVEKFNNFVGDQELRSHHHFLLGTEPMPLQ